MATLRFGRKAPTLTDYLGVTSPRKSRKDGYYRIVNLSYNVPLGGWEYGAMTIDEVEAWLKTNDPASKSHFGVAPGDAGLVGTVEFVS